MSAADDGGNDMPRFEVLHEHPPAGLVRRLLTTWRHFFALFFGGLSAHLATLPAERRWTLRIALLRSILFWPTLLVRRDLARQPFPVQLRRRLELLGPTYIKLGQVLSLREDLLPREITSELKNLLDRLPALPGKRFVELVSKHLGRPAEQVFTYVNPEPVGSASIGQIHLARTHQGERVVLKMVKPGIREMLETDAVLLRMLGAILQVFLARFEPRQVIAEFCYYTLREVDLRLEADNAETFAANFRDLPDIVFPRIWRQYSSRDLLCMEFMDGFKPTDPRAQELTREDREQLVDLGAQAIIQMLYRDGFFHADLHPGNLMILPGPRLGFIDVGMVGRFDDDLKRALLYYFYCLVMGDIESAARYLTALAKPGPGADARAFRRDIEDICRRWTRSASFSGFSMGQLILESVSRGGQYRMSFPVEMVLMVKAIVTFEGVGHILQPGFDVAGVAKTHVSRILVQRFMPLRIARESLRGAPELVDTLIKVPNLISEGLQLLEQMTHRPAENPFAGIRGTLFGGFCLVAGAIFAAYGGPWPVWAALVTFGLLIPLRKGR